MIVMKRALQHLLKRHPVVVRCGTLFLLLSLLASLGIGLFELPDSFFYAVLGQFLLTGYLTPVYPFNVSIPSTLYAPVYSYLSAVILSTPWPWGITLIPFVQLLLVFVTGIIVYYLLQQFVSRMWAIVGAILFFLLPFTFVYAMMFMSEIADMFLLSVFLLVLYRVMHRQSPSHPGFLVFCTAAATLTHNLFVFLFAGSILYWIGCEFSGIFRKKINVKPYSIAGRIAACVGIGGIVLWMGFNYRYYGTWALTIAQGRTLYNGVVEQAHLLPPDDSPILKEFLQRAQTKEALMSPNGEVGIYFAPEFYAGTITEKQVDRLFLRFALEALKNNSVAYTSHILQRFFTVPVTAPYDSWIHISLELATQDCPECGDPALCRASWNNSLCKPALDIPWLREAFLSFIHFQESFYPYPMGVVFLFALVGTIVAIRAKGFLMVVGILFLFFHGVQLTGVADGRYLLRLYPLYAICILLGLRTLIIYLAAIFKKTVEIDKRK